jgi:hypothetical protein
MTVLYSIFGARYERQALHYVTVTAVRWGDEELHCFT